MKSMGQGIETLRLVERAAGVLAQREVRVSWPPPRLPIGPEWIDGDVTPDKVARAFRFSGNLFKPKSLIRGSPV